MTRQPRRRATPLHAASLALLLAGPALAQTPPVGVPDAASAAALPAGPMTLFQLTDFALRHHPEAQAAWSLAQEDVARVAAAQALLRPVVSATVPLTAAHGGAPAGGTANASPGGVTYGLAPAIGLSWVLFDGGARASGVEAARWQAAASQLTYNRALQTLVSDVEQRYYALLTARQLEAALQVGVAAAQASVDVAKAQRSAGLATVGETSQAEAALGQAQLAAVQARATSRSASGALADAIGAPVDAELPLVDEDRFDALSPAGRLDDLLQLARASRADLAALSAQVRQARAEVDAAQAQGRPSLSFGATAARTWSRGGGNTTSAANQQVGLTLSIPIFDGGLVRAQTQAARARLQAATAQRDVQRQAVDLDVWQSYQFADSSEAAVNAAQAALRSATVAEDAARERYRSGVGLLIELLAAQTTAAQARASLVQARYDGLLALARLGYAIGANGIATTRSAANGSRPSPDPLSPSPHAPVR